MWAVRMQDAGSRALWMQDMGADDVRGGGAVDPRSGQGLTTFCLLIGELGH